jgi:hypothetical protein
MTEPVQLELPLVTPPDPDGVDPNRKNILTAVIKNNYLGSHSSWQIFRSWNKDKTAQFWLGIRTHYYETDYDYIEPVSREEAVWLIKTQDVREFLDCLKK